jgi:hypothetical protein
MENEYMNLSPTADDDDVELGWWSSLRIERKKRATTMRCN